MCIYRKLDSVNSIDFRNDSLSTLLLICNNFKQSIKAGNFTESSFDKCFYEFMNALSKIIKKRAPIYKTSKKQKRFLQKA